MYYLSFWSQRPLSEQVFNMPNIQSTFTVIHHSQHRGCLISDNSLKAQLDYCKVQPVLYLTIAVMCRVLQYWLQSSHVDRSPLCFLHLRMIAQITGQDNSSWVHILLDLLATLHTVCKGQLQKQQVYWQGETLTYNPKTPMTAQWVHHKNTEGGCPAKVRKRQLEREWLTFTGFWVFQNTLYIS